VKREKRKDKREEKRRKSPGRLFYKIKLYGWGA
jgi:hypothetical protein